MLQLPPDGIPEDRSMPRRKVCELIFRRLGKPNSVQRRTIRGNRCQLTTFHFTVARLRLHGLTT